MDEHRGRPIDMKPVHTSLPKVGVCKTRQRTAIMDLLNECGTFMSVKQIHGELGERGTSVGLTTVYRTVQSLAEVHAVDVLHRPSGESLYRACTSESHHHHLVCIKCGTTVEIDGGPVEKWAEKVAAEHGFTLTGHEAEIYGICANCAAQDTAAQDTAAQ